MPEEQEDNYRDTCPNCGGPIVLTSCEVSGCIPISKDGWSFDDARGQVNTDEEEFACYENCLDCGPWGTAIPSAWVFNDEEMTKELAIKEMRYIAQGNPRKEAKR